jgi:hypothetical protein
MKTYAPKELRGDDLRGLLDDLAASPLQVSKFLRVTERSVWRWLADGSAPYAVLAALWHETPHGRHVVALDVGNELVIVRGLAKSWQSQSTVQAQQLARVLAISDTGAANDPLLAGPFHGQGRVSPKTAVQEFVHLPAYDDPYHANRPGAAPHFPTRPIAI